jgi:hypothetical protein
MKHSEVLEILNREKHNKLEIVRLVKTLGVFKKADAFLGLKEAKEFCDDFEFPLRYPEKVLAKLLKVFPYMRASITSRKTYKDDKGNLQIYTEL